MLCERCKIANANIHLTEIIKDEKSEIHLCENCAKYIGLNAKLSKYSFSVDDILSFVNFNLRKENNNSTVCNNCGFIYDSKNKYRMGCSKCYDYHNINIDKALNINYNHYHKGKRPGNYNENNIDEKIIIEFESDAVEDLKKQLELAVNEERYEDAAILRDKIMKNEKIYRE